MTNEKRHYATFANAIITNIVRNIYQNKKVPFLNVT